MEDGERSDPSTSDLGNDRVSLPVRHERGRRRYVENLTRSGAVREMEDRWPSSVGLRGQALNHP
ncbi:MAG TPA: hypothetical protein VGA30_12265, partial [Actinomycetota bacterium]